MVTWPCCYLYFQSCHLHFGGIIRMLGHNNGWLSLFFVTSCLRRLAVCRYNQNAGSLLLPAITANLQFGGPIRMLDRDNVVYKALTLFQNLLSLLLCSLDGAQSSRWIVAPCKEPGCYLIQSPLVTAALKFGGMMRMLDRGTLVHIKGTSCHSFPS